MKNESFVFYATWDECLAILAPAQRAALYRAIVNKARFGIDLDDDAPRALRAIMSLISPQIEANRERYQKCVEQGRRGAEGGRPRKSATAAADAKSAATAAKSAATASKSAGSAAKSAASAAKSAASASKSAASAAKFDAAASAPVASALPVGWGGPVHEPSAGRAAVVDNPVSGVEIPVSDVENSASNVEFPASPAAGYPLETAVSAMRAAAVPMRAEALGYQRETESETPGVNSETLNDNGYDNDNVNEFGVKKEREKEKGIDGAPCGEWVADAPALSKSAPKLGEGGHGLPAAASLNAQPASPDAPPASPDALATSPDAPPAEGAAPPVAAGAAPNGAPPASAAVPPKPKKKPAKAKSKEMAAAAAGLASLWRAQKARLDLPARQAAFWEDVQREGSRKHVAADTLRAFWMYWGELCGGGRMRCEREKTWQTSMRLGRWAINQRSYDRRAAVPPAGTAVAAPVVREAGREGLMAGCGFRSPAVLPEAALGAPTGILRF